MAESLSVSDKTLRKALWKMQTRKLARIERRPAGRGYDHRIFPTEKTMISATELIEKLGPFIKELHIEGRRDMASFVPKNVAALAVRLQRILDEWTGKTPIRPNNGLVPSFNNVQMSETNV